MGALLKSDEAEAKECGVSLPTAHATQSTWMGVRTMPALGERGSATRARSLLCGGGRAGVTGTLLAEPISIRRKRVGQGPARGEEGCL